MHDRARVGPADRLFYATVTTMTPLNGGRGELLDYTGVAALLGVSPRSVHTYRWRGDMPDVDRMVGRTPCWYEQTIREWIPTRPGRGRPVSS